VRNHDEPKSLKTNLATKFLKNTKIQALCRAFRIRFQENFRKYFFFRGQDVSLVEAKFRKHSRIVEDFDSGDIFKKSSR